MTQNKSDSFCSLKRGEKRLDKKNNFLVAITGGIGSGKSTAANALKEAGYPVTSCDEICAGLYKSPSFLRKLKKFFPSAIKGTLFPKADKKELSRLIFDNDENYKILSEQVTVPVYRAAMKKAKKKKGVVFIEVPLLFEFGKQSDFDKVLVIMREKSDREESVKKRSGLNEKEFSARLSRQTDYSKADLSGYTVILNDGTKEDLTSRAVAAAKGFSAEFLKENFRERNK